MNKGLIFVGGFALGFVSGWMLLKTAYQRIAEEEIDEVRERYHKRTEHLKEESEKKFDDAVSAFKKYSGDKEEDDLPFVYEEEGEHPYIISPNDFGEYDDYNTITLTFYEDGVLTDENDEPLDVELIGAKNLEYFGVYEEDAVYIRSDPRKSDYEILRVHQNHEDILEHMPPLPVMDVTGDHLIVNDEFEVREEDEE